MNEKESKRSLRPIVETVEANFDRGRAEKFHRFCSWEHCHDFFTEWLSSSRGDRDLAALHLGFFLASWGMYRGSSFLLGKDYRVHLDAIDVLSQPRWPPLLDCSFDTAANRIDDLLALVNQIQATYKPYESVEGRGKRATLTLATKIALGALGCLPAYDRYFVLGLKKEGLPFSYLNKRNLSHMLIFAREHEDKFVEIQRRIAERGVDYPLMKLLDMYFWEVGRQA